MVMRPPKKKSKTTKPMVGIPGLVSKMIKSLGLTAAQQLKLKKQMKQAGGMKSSDSLKAAAAQLKRKQRQFTAAGRQSKGPVGTKLKKVSKLKF